MDKTEITRARIIDAACALHDAGIAVTGPTLRERLGSGDPDQLILVWKDYLASSLTEAGGPLPAEISNEIMGGTLDLSEQITKLISQLHTKVAVLAERRVLKMARILVDEREQAAHRMNNAARICTDLQNQLSALHTENESRGQQITELMGALRAQEAKYLESVAQLHEQFAVLQHDAEAASRRHVAELANAQEMQERCQNELHAARAEATTERARVQVPTGSSPVNFGAIRTVVRFAPPRAAHYG